MSDRDVIRQAWSEALPLAAYIETMPVQRERMRERLSKLALTDSERAALGSSKIPAGGLAQVSHILVLTEPGCGDSLMVIPIIARIAEALSSAELHITVRDVVGVLNQHYRERGIKSIPMVGFYDASFDELATWVEQPQALVPLMTTWKAAHPRFVEIRSASELGDAERRELLAPFFARLLVAKFAWYDGEPGLNHEVVAEILALLVRPPAP